MEFTNYQIPTLNTSSSGRDEDDDDDSFAHQYRFECQPEWTDLCVGGGGDEEHFVDLWVGS